MKATNRKLKCKCGAIQFNIFSNNDTKQLAFKCCHCDEIYITYQSIEKIKGLI